MTTEDELRELIALGDKATPRPWRGDRYDGTVKYGIKGGSDNGYVLLYNDDAERSQFSRDLGNCDDEFIIAAANLAQTIARELIAAREEVQSLRERIAQLEAWITR